MKIYKQIYLIWIPFLLLFLSTNVLLGQVTFNVNGNWSYVADNVLEAGSDFSGTYLSDAAQVYLTATTSKAKGNFNWKVSVHKEDVSWNNSLQLFVQRTGAGFSSGNGNGGGLIQGGSLFQQVGNLTQDFFSGKKGRVDIPIQYQVAGVSVLIPADTYTTTVVFTLTEE